MRAATLPRKTENNFPRRSNTASVVYHNPVQLIDYLRLKLIAAFKIA